MAGSQQGNEAIFHAARDISNPERRREYVRDACGRDEARISHVEALLAAADTGDSLLDRPAVSDAAPTSDQPTAGLGTVIGPYKLVEQIGEGGMGTVWMAQQSEPVKRLVALKVIKPGMDSRQVIARFEAERQALALMDHPNIARVLDGGTTSTGRPYFVMDLVRGTPITRYCDEHHLTPRQRLELFIPVCQAIQHAHQKGIIHRDLKPSNVLVALYDGKPVPKVIDFGVAKAAGQPLTEQTLVTGFGNIVGTLEYMSPEQAELNQLDIDTRSDIYSLGVLLYELLTGSTPFSRKELERAGMLEMLRVIREQEPSKPSTKLSTAEGLPTLAANRGTEPAKLTRLVRGELDWIVMKALEKDRSRRYETAVGFAADLQRYLDDEPVQACPPSAAYRMRKFARRNKATVAVSALVLFFFVLIGSGVGWAVRDRAAREAAIAQERANREAELKRESEARRAKVAGQVESIFGEVDGLEGEQKWPEALAAARRAEAAVAGGEADPATAERVHQRLKDLIFIDRLEQIRMLRATYVEGHFDDAGADRGYARAFREYGVDIDELAIESSIDPLKSRPALAVPLAAILDDWVSVRRVVSKADVAGWQRLVAVARGLDPDPLRNRLRSTWGQPVIEVREELRRLAESIDIWAQHPATLLCLVQQLRAAKHLDYAIRLLRDAQYAYPGDFWLKFELGLCLFEQRDFEEATRFFTAAASIRPNSSPAHDSLGALLGRQKKVVEAITCYRKAIELDPKNAHAYGNLGAALIDQGKPDEAIAACRKVLELEPNSKHAAKAYFTIGKAPGEFEERLASIKKAVELDPTLVEAHNCLAWRLTNGWDVKRRDPQRALEAARTAVELAPQDPFTWKMLGWARYRAGDWKGSVEALEKSCGLWSQDDPKGGDAYQWFFLAMAHWRLGEKDKAREWYDRAVKWMEANAKDSADLIRFRAEAEELMKKE